MAVMVKLQTMIIAVLCVMVIALAAVLFVVYERQTEQVISPDNKAVQTAAQKTPAMPPQQQVQPPRQPPSAEGASSDLQRYMEKAPISQNAATMHAERQMRTDKMERLKELQAQFKELSANGKTPDIDELDRLLAELIGIQGTSVIAGVDLNVLRQNLRVAQEVQLLAKELEAESKKPTPDQNRILEITNKIQAIQGELNPNVMAGSASGDMPALPPLPANDAKKE